MCHSSSIYVIICTGKETEETEREEEEEQQKSEEQEEQQEKMTSEVECFLVEREDFPPNPLPCFGICSCFSSVDFLFRPSFGPF